MDEHTALIKQAAAALGRIGGKKTSDRKTAACKENGKLGGWKKGRARKVKVEDVTVSVGGVACKGFEFTEVIIKKEVTE